MNESEKQFSFTRAASSTSGRAKNQIPISPSRTSAKEAAALKAIEFSKSLFLALTSNQAKAPSLGFPAGQKNRGNPFGSASP